MQTILLVVYIYGIGSTRPSAHAYTTCRNGLKWFDEYNAGVTTHDITYPPK